MKARLALLLLSVCMLSGCYFNGRLYPVQGPPSAQTPPPIYTARISGGFRSGKLTATLQNGELYTGTWARVSTKPSAKQTGNPPTSTEDLSKAWDTVYGAGFYTAHVLGAPLHIHGVLSGAKGAALQVDAYVNQGPDPGAGGTRKGVAYDTNGNIYKLVL
jgi:hypothetical protein